MQAVRQELRPRPRTPSSFENEKHFVGMMNQMKSRQPVEAGTLWVSKQGAHAEVPVGQVNARPSTATTSSPPASVASSSMPAGATASVTSQLDSFANSCALQQKEQRIIALEETLKKVNKMLKEYHAEDRCSAGELRQRVHALSEQLIAARGERRLFEEKLVKLQEQVNSERQEREEWFATFRASMQKAFEDIDAAVSRSLPENLQLLSAPSVDEELIERLTRRVDEVLGKAAPSSSSSASSSAVANMSGHAWLSMRAAGGPQAQAVSAPHAAPLRSMSPPAPSPPGPRFDGVLSRQEPRRPSPSGHDTASATVPAVPTQAAEDSSSNHEVLRDWTTLLNENLKLQQEQQQLLNKRRLALENRLTRSAGGSPLTQQMQQRLSTPGRLGEAAVSRSSVGRPSGAGGVRSAGVANLSRTALPVVHERV
eukprot:TRINITY_DN26004_c0_g1_i1.p1 TRINITY_DN26004_c0_g1~~TRINITY_DN26004_c0_g1_i1.p1  ORF type:complete len:426 (+),score=117.47 TRINITY_DN26004_c0_g1_i1:168-1445(+)